LCALTFSNILLADIAMNENGQYFNLEDVDKFFTDNPVDIEKNMTVLLPEAKS
jgi:hypothetical protein